MSENKKDVLEGDDLVPAIVYIPKNTACLKMTASIIDKKKNFIEAEWEMELEDIVEARIEGYEWEDENVRWVLNSDFLNDEE